MKCYVIAEAGVNHNGNEDMALQLVHAAADAGADAVKFQTFRAASLVTKKAKTAEYQRNNAGTGSQYQMLKQLELSEGLHYLLRQRCEDHGLDFLSTPFDSESAQFLDDLGMKRIKVASGELTNLPFIRLLASYDKPLIVSTGMASLEEVRETVNVIAEVRKENGFAAPLASMLTVLHCTSNYPASLETVNLKAMQKMADSFQVPVGYSDHTDGILIAPVAVAMGAQVIEKHFTLDRDLLGPDHQASLTPSELTLMVEHIRAVEQSLGDGIKAPAASELAIRDLVHRSVALACDVPSGAIVKSSDLVLLRPGTGIVPKDRDRVIGRTLKMAQVAGTLLSWDDLK